MENAHDDSIVIKKRGYQQNISQDNIIFIESLNRNLLLHTTTGIYEMCRYALKDLIAELGHDFIRCHHSYIVNKKYMKDINKRKQMVVVADDGDTIEIPIGRVYKSNIWQIVVMHNGNTAVL